MSSVFVRRSCERRGGRAGRAAGADRPVHPVGDEGSGKWGGCVANQCVVASGRIAISRSRCLGVYAPSGVPVTTRVAHASRECGGVAETSAEPGDPVERALRAQALADIARKHHGSLLRILTQRTGSVEEAKDIAQEAYVKVLAVERRDGISSLAGYLWRSALNLVTDRARRRAVRERFARAARTEAEPLAPSAETVVDARQRLEVIERAVGQLPPRCLDAFLLRIVQGRPFDEVGREMGISARMAKVYVARALASLQARLEEGGSAGNAQSPHGRAEIRARPARRAAPKAIKRLGRTGHAVGE